MAARICSTAIALLLAAGGFLGAAPAPPGPLDPFGVVFLVISGTLWFGWEMIGDAFAYRNEIRGADRQRGDLMLLRLGPLLRNKSRR